MKSLSVALADRSYPIRFVHDVASANPLVEEFLADREGPVATVIDATVAEKHPLVCEFLGQLGPVLRVPGGEGSKSLGWMEKGWDFLAQEGIDRTGCLVVVGGGVVGDLGGFLAASWLRGIDFIQIPTTLLAMVDSSVGGKTGINTSAGKNLVGAFHQPRLVVIGNFFLETLPPREFSAGMAEVIKAGMLAEASLFERLEELPPLQPGAAELLEVIQAACAIKARVVAEDEKETAAEGGRALLNLGHTFAHAIEKVAGYGTYLHGEAVAIGLHMAAKFSAETGALPESMVNRVRGLLEKYQLPVTLREPLSTEVLVQAMGKDKKNRGASLRLVLLKSIGEAYTKGGFTPDQLARFWDAFQTPLR
ncbi:MAG: 3-dehydroquinate synthase [Opitutales bacterium]|nr:3-dehydroquinate synthase [Opitutales bacterium]MCH8540280.1 3-dehydroquinate synthase [Opitutales bacterium]